MIIQFARALSALTVVGAVLAPPVRPEGRSSGVGRSKQRPYAVLARFVPQLTADEFGVVRVFEKG